ncbi:MAG: glutamate--tRNA ligase [Deltaproteobacteria bacterium HGW-Deltaproteobacteria-4]|nr:MAG: glutamate--tRNA ligase [Deltaproteobacteria bacterium HGW-Deltaproteobacteria-4]
MSQLRVRFAPSPTGYLHIGGARTALFNFLLARKEQGTFILRIEDTDVARSTQTSVDAILQAMDWLGLNYDEGPIYQSDRFDLYRNKVQELIAAGKAYRCYCTPEELEQRREAAMKSGGKPKYDRTCLHRHDQPDDRPYAIRFLVPDGETAFVDRIKGTISFQNEELDDLIIQRSDNTPTYNFVVVVDDAEMGMTLVLRGDDHVNNTPRQILLYQALGYAVPEFAHVPMILGADKTRLSKRHGATSVMEYRVMGFLPEALVNYLARLGWSCGDEEIFSMEELIAKFDLNHVGRSAGVFNPEKLLWLNAHYIKTGDRQRLAALLKEYLGERGIETEGGPDLVGVVKSLQERSHTMVEMAEGAAFYFADKVDYLPEAVSKCCTPEAKAGYQIVLKHLSALEDFSHDAIAAAFNQAMSETGLKLGKLAPPVRVALNGTTTSPSVYEVLEVLGKERSLSRLRQGEALFAT